MKELRTKIVVLFTFLMLVAAWGFWWLQTVLMQAGAIGAYPFIPVVFYFSGIVHGLPVTACAYFYSGAIPTSHWLTSVKK